MMIHPDFQAAMARERTAMLTASAAARRQARELRQARRLRLAARWMRFLGRKNTLTEAELRYYTGIDYHDHEAPGAVDHVRGGGVGIARYVRDHEDRGTAEIDLTCGRAQAS